MANIAVFDIGHGVNTYPPSKGVPGFAEHTFNSNVVIEAKKLAEENGFKVILTQQPFKRDVPLSKRIAQINNANKKDKIVAVISFHANASGSKQANGKGVFYYRGSRNGKKLAQLWLKHSSVLPVKNWGKGLWECIPGTWSDFYLVRATAPPTILIEHFFYTNPLELKKCNTRAFERLSAEVAVKALCEYVGKSCKFGKESTADSKRDYLQLGDRGKEVKKLQEKIAKLGGSKMAIDGIFGKETFEKVRTIQKRGNLEVDGIFGKDTIIELEKRLEAIEGKKEKDLTRVFVEGKQEGVYSVDANVIDAVKRNIDKKNIIIDKERVISRD